MLKLRNSNVLPQQEYDTITILGLELPVRDRLAFGAQVEVIDLQTKYAAGDMGEFEYLVRLFCVFTRSLPKQQQVRYEWLSRQDLVAEDVAELTAGTLELLNALRNTQEGDTKNEETPAPKKETRAKEPKSSTP